MSALTGPVVVLADLSWPIVSRIPLIGDLAVSPHGIAIGIGFAVGSGMLLRRARLRGITPLGIDVDLDEDEVDQEVLAVLGWVLVGAIVAARLFFVLTHLDVYADDPVRVLAIQEGGLTFIGGVTGGVALGWFAARRRGLDPVALLDAAAPGLALGLAVGRVGDLAIGDHLGAPTSAPWGWRCRGDFNPVGDPNALGWTSPLPYPDLAVRSGAIEAPVVGCSTRLSCRRRSWTPSWHWWSPACCWRSNDGSTGDAEASRARGSFPTGSCG